MHALESKTLQEQRYSKLLKLLIYNIDMYKDLLSINEQKHISFASQLHKTKLYVMTISI